MYYLVLRPGTGVSPCNVDGVLASYAGTYLQNTKVLMQLLLTTSFEELNIHNNYWFIVRYQVGERFSQFTGDTPIANADGTVTYNNFGQVLCLFLRTRILFCCRFRGIPTYVPLILNLNCMQYHRLDQDNDGIPSYLEDQNGDGYFGRFSSGVVNPDDTDGDGIPNF
jgi:hypothetical protein